MFTKINLFLQNKFGEEMTLQFLSITFLKCLVCVILAIPIMIICLGLFLTVFYISIKYSAYTVLLIYLALGIFFIIKTYKN